jgi:type VII secretion integral membrane protein EccD
VALPLVAFRLARIVMTPLPTQPEHLQQDIDPVPSEGLLARTAAADRYMTAMHAGLGLVVSGGLLLVARDGTWPSVTLILLVALVCVLMLRPLTSGWHRLSLAVPAVTGASALLLHTLAGAGTPARLIAVTLLLLAGIGLVAVARLLPERRITPYWGRIGDITQLVATVALLPVLLAVLDVYTALRALGG